MENNLLVKKSIHINASTAKVWDALINPDKIKQWLFGTETISDWKKGSRITYKGVWEGKEYVDGGIILHIEPEKIFQSTYWSSMSGKEDKPENYATVTYSLEKDGDGTLLTLTQDNIKTVEVKEHSEKNWGIVLESLKNVAEKIILI